LHILGVLSNTLPKEVLQQWTLAFLRPIENHSCWDWCSHSEKLLHSVEKAKVGKIIASSEQGQLSGKLAASCISRSDKKYQQ
jgi:hypothetical protein